MLVLSGLPEFRLFITSLFLVIAGGSQAVCADEPRWTLSVNLKGQRLEGFPLRTADNLISLMLCDGRLVEFSPSEVTNFRKLSSSFQPFSNGEMRAELMRELPKSLEVTGTGHYVVAHPRGEGDKWAARFEELYRSMTHYFSVRGFQMREPEFPLAAIVWNKREDFLRYAAAEGSSLPSGVIGYYSMLSNRITLYDMAAGSNDPEAWKQNASTIIHEATHQTAFNTGIHQRFADTPKWVIEGLGTLFEPRGVWDARHYSRLEDRINRERLASFRQYLKSGRPPQGFMLVVADDRLFNSNALAAYAESWALSFYLSEKEPRKYSAYLAKTGALKPFQPYRTDRRLADFKAVFGENTRMLEANYLRFIEGLK
jgi:hypothetical protein